MSFSNELKASGSFANELKPQNSFMLKEDTFFLLLESGFKIYVSQASNFTNELKP